MPLPITRRRFEERLPPDAGRRPPIRSIASADHYGLDRSVAIWVPDWPKRGAPQPVPRERIIPADLSAWRYQTPRDHIAVDPELGRFAFPVRQLPRGNVYVSYGYGFAAPIGGGEYSRPVRRPPAPSSTASAATVRAPTTRPWRRSSAGGPRRHVPARR